MKIPYFFDLFLAACFCVATILGNTICVAIRLMSNEGTVSLRSDTPATTFLLLVFAQLLFEGSVYSKEYGMCCSWALPRRSSHSSLHACRLESVCLFVYLFWSHVCLLLLLFLSVHGSSPQVQNGPCLCPGGSHCGSALDHCSSLGSLCGQLPQDLVDDALVSPQFVVGTHVNYSVTNKVRISAFVVSLSFQPPLNKSRHLLPNT